MEKFEKYIDFDTEFLVKHPFVSVIIPVYRNKHYLYKCLRALEDSSFHDYEIIVVNDCPDVTIVEIKHHFNVNLIELKNNSGPSVARNIGASHARGEILIFVDSDVLVSRDLISLIVDYFKQNTEVFALFGSYDANPTEKNLISQYKNLIHHYHHQHASIEAFTFWAGCGAVKKDIFGIVGGFNQKLYTKPCVEDIELGYRIRQHGYRIHLNKDLLVKHQKHWTFLGLIKTDIFQRAIPWSYLILQTKQAPNDLNLKHTDKISSILALLLFFTPILFSLQKLHFIDINLNFLFSLFTLTLIGLIALNRQLYLFFKKERGFIFMIRCIPLHIFYFLYSAVSFFYCLISTMIIR